MKPISKLKRAAMLKIGRPNFLKIIQMENRVKEQYDCIPVPDTAPTRFDIPLEAMKRIEAVPTTQFFSFKALPIMLGSVKGMVRATRDLKHNPLQPRIDISGEELAKMEAFAEKRGANLRKRVLI